MEPAAPHKIQIKQEQTMTARTRRKVTTCLYLSRNNRARSMSTLMAADIRTDITGKVNEKK